MEDDTKLYNSVKFVHPSHNEGINFSSLSNQRKVNAFLYPMTDKESERTSMKLEFDYSSITNDKAFCKEVGQEIIWEQNPSYICTKDDLLTDEKKEAFEKTIDNLSNFIGRLLRIKHSDISLRNYRSDYTYIDPPNKTSKADHYISIFIRPFEDTTIASSQSIRREITTGRTVQSMIVFDPKFIPTAAEDENTDERRFFLTTFHELMHSLDIGYSSLVFWTSRDKGKPAYIGDTEFTRSTYPTKTFYHICTPKAKEVASRRLGISRDNYGKDICIEFEDNGYEGTIHEHPKATLYRQDVMAGIQSADSVISEVTLALLEDMGWFTVNWSLAQPMTWGAKELISTTEADDYVEKPAYKYIPKSYISDSSHPLDLGHDFRSWGEPLPKFLYDTNEDPYDIKEYGDLYIPSDQMINPNSPYDYVPLKNYINVCRGNKFAYLSKDYSEGRCLETSIEQDYRIKITISENNVAYCSTKDDTFQVDGKEFMCNDLKTIDKIIEFLAMPPHDYGHITLVGDRGVMEVTKLKITWVGYLFMGLFIFLLTINLIYWLFVCTSCGRFCCQNYCPLCNECCICLGHMLINDDDDKSETTTNLI